MPHIHSLWRSPVKGLTMERLAAARLEAGQPFPGDRAFAVEVGASGFDPARPAHIPKQKFTVLARFPQLAQLETALDDATGDFTIGPRGGPRAGFRLDAPDGQAKLAAYLADFLDGEIAAPLRVLPAPPGHAFMDTFGAAVSVINLASVRAVAAAIGRPVDALRFRGNILVEDWPAWAEDALSPGDRIEVGGAVLEMIEPAVRCIATHAHPETGLRDIDMLGELHRHFARRTLGLLCRVAEGGLVAQGDPFRTPE